MLQLQRRLFLTALCLISFSILAVSGGAARAEGADSFIVVDANSGRVLNAMNPDARLYPASMTKIMTLYMTFEALSQGRLSLRTQLPVSELAASQAPSKLGLRPGSTVSVETCIYAAVTLSANDCAMVLAEGIGGSEGQFARMMTSRAQSLGMLNTHYNNPNGLPDEGQITTARDMATLAEALIQRFPKYYPYFATRTFTYNGIPHANHNHLMSRYAGMDGIKTGFIRASGFNLTASAVRNGHRLIAVVFGGSSAVSRDNYMAGLLDDGFRRIAGQPAPSELRAPAPAVAMAPVPPSKLDVAATGPALAATTGQIAGTHLAEAGDAVEANESETPPASAVPPGPVIGEIRSVTPAPALETAPAAPAPAPAVADAPSADPIGEQAAALATAKTEVVPAGTTPAEGQAPASSTSPAAPSPATAAAPGAPADMAEGDADIPEPPPPAPSPSVHKVSATRAAPRPAQWRAQLGTYSSKAVSDAMLQKAVDSLPQSLKASAKPQSVAIRTSHRTVYRATIMGLDQAGAKHACSILTHCTASKSS